MDYWIPLTKETPSDEQRCLVTCAMPWGDYRYVDLAYYSTNLYGVDARDFRDKKRPGFYHYNGDFGMFQEVYYVRAWVPAPEPYKGD